MSRLEERIRDMKKKGRTDEAKRLEAEQKREWRKYIRFLKLMPGDHAGEA